MLKEEEQEFSQIAWYVSGRRQRVSDLNLSVQPELFYKLQLQNMLILLICVDMSKICFIFSLNIPANSFVASSIDHAGKYAMIIKVTKPTLSNNQNMKTITYFITATETFVIEFEHLLY